MSSQSTSSTSSAGQDSAKSTPASAAPVASKSTASRRKSRRQRQKKAKAQAAAAQSTAKQDEQQDGTAGQISAQAAAVTTDFSHVPVVDSFDAPEFRDYRADEWRAFMINQVGAIRQARQETRRMKAQLRATNRLHKKLETQVKNAETARTLDLSGLPAPLRAATLAGKIDWTKPFHFAMPPEGQTEEQTLAAIAATASYNLSDDDSDSDQESEVDSNSDRFVKPYGDGVSMSYDEVLKEIHEIFPPKQEHKQ